MRKEFWICCIPFFTQLSKGERAEKRNTYRVKLMEAGFDKEEWKYESEQSALFKAAEIQEFTGLGMTVTKRIDW